MSATDSFDNDERNARVIRNLQARVAELEAALNDLLNDCINFDGGKLTDIFMERASRALKKHIESETCWCCPTVEEYENGKVIIHHKGN